MDQQFLVQILVLFLLSWYLGQIPDLAAQPLHLQGDSAQEHSSQRDCLQLTSSTIPRCHSFLHPLLPICSQRTGKVGAGGFVLVSLDRAHVEKLPVMSNPCWVGLH